MSKRKKLLSLAGPNGTGGTILNAQGLPEVKQLNPVEREVLERVSRASFDQGFKAALEALNNSFEQTKAVHGNTSLTLGECLLLVAEIKRLAEEAMKKQ
jgi:hypothetical protein